MALEMNACFVNLEQLSANRSKIEIVYQKEIVPNLLED